MLKKNTYKWHRTSSLIIAIPVMLWAFSGFLHPVMTNIRPKVATQGIKSMVIDCSKIKIPLQTALRLNHIDSFNSVRLVHMDTSWFYQVQQVSTDQTLYMSVSNGDILKNGDTLYAQYLARTFLGDKVAIKDISVITSFNPVYQSVNRILPVYKVSFQRKDGIAIYVQTTQDRFVFAADKYRAAFSIFFNLVHTWGWLRFLGKGKLLVELFFAGLAFLTTLMGIYIFFTTKSKKVKGNELVKARRNHRYVAITVSLFTLMFTFSGFYHAFSKLEKKRRKEPLVQNLFPASQIDLNVGQLQLIVHKPITNISLVRLNDSLYWQVYYNTQQSNQPKDLMRDREIQTPIPVYINTIDKAILPEGEEKYAVYLATQFSQYDSSDLQSVTRMTKFDADYNFADKLLPVCRISYNKDHNVRYYVETSTGKLSKWINDNEGYESYSFAFLHKHEFLRGFGKSVKDSSTMFWALAQIAMVTIGLRLWWKKRKATH